MTRTLLVASPGGHIDELYDLAPRITGVGSDRRWVTSKTPHTARLLAQEPTQWVAPIASRQGGRALAQLPQALVLIRRYRPDLVISTGAALAMPYLLAASLLRVETHYIESATRLDGPSLTGRMVARLPGARLHHQGFRSSVASWGEVGSIFDGFAPGPEVDRVVASAVVILGTERYPFIRALEEVGRAFPSTTGLLVQAGQTPIPPGAAYRPWVPFDELTEAIAASDVVITHAGVGSVLGALRAGKHPVVLPRSAERGEHVDDHQLELAGMLAARNLASVALSGTDLSSLLGQAARRSTVRSDSRPIEL